MVSCFGDWKKRQELNVVNAWDLCEGVKIRQRSTVDGEEISIIDYVIICKQKWLLYWKSKSKTKNGKKGK